MVVHEHPRPKGDTYATNGCHTRLDPGFRNRGRDDWDHVLQAQPAAATRTGLLKTDLVGIEGKEAVMLTVEGGPGLVGGKHYHPGYEFAYVLEGSLVMEVEGKPPVTLKAGDTFHIPPKVVHRGNNASTTAPYKVWCSASSRKGSPTPRRCSKGEPDGGGGRGGGGGERRGEGGGRLYYSAVCYEDKDLRDAGLWAKKIAGTITLRAGTPEVDIDPGWGARPTRPSSSRSTAQSSSYETGDPA